MAPFTDPVQASKHIFSPQPSSTFYGSLVQLLPPRPTSTYLSWVLLSTSDRAVMVRSLGIHIGMKEMWDWLNGCQATSSQASITSHAVCDPGEADLGLLYSLNSRSNRRLTSCERYTRGSTAVVNWFPSIAPGYPPFQFAHCIHLVQYRLYKGVEYHHRIWNSWYIPSAGYQKPICQPYWVLGVNGDYRFWSWPAKTSQVSTMVILRTLKTEAKSTRDPFRDIYNVDIGFRPMRFISCCLSL